MSKTDIGVTPQNNITISGYLALFKYPVLLGAGALVVINVLDVCLPLIVRYFIDNLTNPVTAGHSPQIVQWCLIAYTSTALIQCFCRYTWRLLLGNTGAKAATQARYQVTQAALGAPNKVSIGDTITVAHSDAEIFARAFDGGIIITIDALLGAISIPCILFYLNPSLAWKVLLPLPLITFLTIYFDGRVRYGAKAVQAANSSMTKIIEGYISDVRMVKANTFEQNCIAHFEKASAELRDKSKRFSVLESLYGPGLESFISLGLVSLMVFGAPAVYQEHITLGTFLVFHKFIEQLQWPMRAMALAATTFRKAQVSGERLRDFNKTYDTSGGNSFQVAEEGDERGQLLSYLRFTFGAHQLELKKGSVTALIGPNGSGKTILLKKLGGLEDLPCGVAFCEGKDLSYLDPHERPSVVGFVSQEPELFALTIRENLLLGGNQEVPYTEEDLWKVLNIAAIDDEVRSFPDKLSTLLGEKGTSLSGGQKQRISLARALLRRPKVLLLDNTFAALDSHTERLVIHRLKEEGMTIIVVTHRLSTIVNCDTTVVMREGDIEVISKTDELLRQPVGWSKIFIETQRTFMAAESIGEELLNKKSSETI